MKTDHQGLKTDHQGLKTDHKCSTVPVEAKQGLENLERMNDYDGLAIGMRVKLRCFGRHTPERMIGVVNGWTEGDTVTIIALMDDGRVVVEGTMVPVSQVIAQQAGYPVGTLIISRGNIDCIVD